METTFPHLRDLRRQYAFLYEKSLRHYPVISYYKLLTTHTEIDPDYYELAESDKRFDVAIEIHGYLMPEKEVSRANEFPAQLLRPAELRVAVPILVVAGLATQDPDTFAVAPVCRPGDRFILSGETFEIMSVLRGEHYVNTDVPLFFRFPSKKFQPEATDFPPV